MLSIDMKNAVNGEKADNFTCLLFRLMFKADSNNFGKLSKGFPVEAKMVWLYKNGALVNEDYAKLEEQAKAEVWGNI